MENNTESQNASQKFKEQGNQSVNELEDIVNETNIEEANDMLDAAFLD